MPWTAAELLAMQEADIYIESTFEEWEAYTREQLLLDQWLDKLALCECEKHSHKHPTKSRTKPSPNYYRSNQSARIAYQRRYRQERHEMIALKRKAVRMADRRQKHESTHSY
jgi:hypothetical protein